jgi:hypothetical protein
MDAVSKSDLLRFVVGLLPSMAPSDAVATMHALTVMGACTDSDGWVQPSEGPLSGGPPLSCALRQVAFSEQSTMNDCACVHMSWLFGNPFIRGCAVCILQ